MIRVCESMLDIEEYRLHAPEVTLSHLQKNGGAGFLRLVKAYFIPDTTRIPDKPISLPYPAWDKYPTKDEKYREALLHLSVSPGLRVYIMSPNPAQAVSYGTRSCHSTVTLSRSYWCRNLMHRPKRFGSSTLVREMRREHAAARKDGVICCQYSRRRKVCLIFVNGAQTMSIARCFTVPGVASTLD